MSPVDRQTIWAELMDAATCCEIEAWGSKHVTPGRVFPRLGARVPRPSLPPPLQTFRAQIERELVDGDGFCIMRLPPRYCADEATAEQFLWHLGHLLGAPVMQDKKGTAVAYVRDEGGQISDPKQRGHKSRAALDFHNDRADLIALLCVREAKEGGESLIVSARAILNLLAANNPEVVRTLFAPFPNHRRGEERHGEAPFTMIPVFSSSPAGLVMRYVRRFIEDSQLIPESPRLAPEQIRAMDAVDEIIHRPDVHVKLKMRPGDILFVENNRILHSRTEFSEYPEPTRKRLMLRLWLCYSASPELCADFRELYSEVRAGTVRGGVWNETS
jgi:hypothetical protein